MDLYSGIINQLIEQFAALPGIGMSLLMFGIGIFIKKRWNIW